MSGNPSEAARFAELLSEQRAILDGVYEIAEQLEAQPLPTQRELKAEALVLKSRTETLEQELRALIDRLGWLKGGSDD